MASDEPRSDHRTAPHDQPLGEWLVSTLADGWEAEPAVAHPAVDGTAQAAFRHRAQLEARFPGAALVVPAGAAPARANDTSYGFRPASAYTYLTGDQAEQGVLVVSGGSATLYLPVRKGPGSVEYLADRRAGAAWVGGVPGRMETEERLELLVRPRTDLAGAVKELAEPRLLRGIDAEVDALLPGAPDGGLGAAIDELRAVKDAWEIERLAEACAATARGFADVVRELPAVLANGGRRAERWLEGTFWRRARFEGNEVGYSSIVAAGAHGTSLHWAPVDGDVVAGQLLLADMGVESTSLYTADITRTLPVDGAWTPLQRRVYGAVQEANRAGIAEVRAGNPFLAAHHAAQWVLADYLRHWGVLEHKPDDALHPDPARPGAQAHRRYTLHSTSHMLGLDVHDCAQLDPLRYLGTDLVAGHCLTVEPGLYFQVNDLTVPAELRGLAVRIEDDVVVTDGEPLVLSSALPTDADELVEWMREI
jgi:Xaa-Pro aminopeptidase